MFHFKFYASSTRDSCKYRVQCRTRASHHRASLSSPRIIISVEVNGRKLETDMNLNRQTLGPTGFEHPVGWGSKLVSRSTSLYMSKEELDVEITLTPKEGGRETVLSGIRVAFEK